MKGFFISQALMLEQQNNCKERFASLNAEATIFQTGLYGIKMCAENILTDTQNIKDYNENRNIRKNIAICCDSKGALLALDQ